MSKFPTHIVFSPHVDDAFLSLGGSIRAWRALGHPVYIVDVFSKSPYTKNGSGNVVGVTRLRKSEELVNSEALGVRVRYCDIPEALLRGYKMRWFGLFPKQIDWTRDNGVMLRVQKLIQRNVRPKAIHYFPLGVGGHVDHVLLREAAKKVLAQKRASSAFYEDVPYVAHYRLPGEFIRELGLRQRLIQIAVAEKKELVCAYKSQYSWHWLVDVRKIAERYSPPSERVWELPKKRSSVKVNNAR